MSNSVTLVRKNQIIKGKINLPASKSECNRALIIQQLIGVDNKVKNTSQSDDSQTLIRILNAYKKEPNQLFDVGPAGTTMRFLTAYFAFQPHTQILTGSERMKNRPIKILVDALKQLGATITYVEKEGYPPIKIDASKKTKTATIQIDGSISSQYISALLLVAPQLPNGLIIKFKGEIVSRPYIEMTLHLMQHFNANTTFENNEISVNATPYQATPFSVESDWSAASYWYQIIAFSPINSVIELVGLKPKSWQGDAVVASIYAFFGVETGFTDKGVFIQKKHNQIPASFEYDFSNCPDLAQTLAVTCAGLSIQAHLSGLKTLKIKETDRIEALQTELQKIGVKTTTTVDTLTIKKGELEKTQTPIFDSYHDHRMAMAFAPLALILESATIKNPEVVSKSYPTFWEDMAICTQEE